MQESYLGECSSATSRERPQFTEQDFWILPSAHEGMYHLHQLLRRVGKRFALSPSTVRAIGCSRFLWSVQFRNL